MTAILSPGLGASSWPSGDEVAMEVEDEGVAEVAAAGGGVSVVIADVPEFVGTVQPVVASIAEMRTTANAFFIVWKR